MGVHGHAKALRVQCPTLIVITDEREALADFVAVFSVCNSLARRMPVELHDFISPWFRVRVPATLRFQES
jgi:hypothetical protein